MVRIRLASVASACLMLAGCGWHLQGSLRLPASVATMHIATEDAYTDFYRELRRALLAAGVQVSPQPLPEGSIFRVRGDIAGQRVAAQSARNTAEEFQVFYAVDYSVEIGGVELLSKQHLELSANYSYDTNAVLAKQREQRQIQEALARELAVQVVRRLASMKTPPHDASAGQP